jgi:hypothetical protein
VTEPANDAVLASLQAARGAIHDSLRPDPPVQAAEPAGAVAPHETAKLAVTTAPPPTWLADHDGMSPAGLGAGASAVHPLLKAAEPLVNEVVGTVVNEAATLVGTVEHGVTMSLTGVTQAVTQALPAVTQILEAVTVPSLQGVGLDALAGLLQPSGASPAAPPGPVDSALSTLDHVLTPIGLDDLHHQADAGLTHMHHAVLPAAGSGLI